MSSQPQRRIHMSQTCGEHAPLMTVVAATHEKVSRIEEALLGKIGSVDETGWIPRMRVVKARVDKAYSIAMTMSIAFVLFCGGVLWAILTGQLTIGRQ
jgi:hypothetical protein